MRFYLPPVPVPLVPLPGVVPGVVVGFGAVMSGVPGVAGKPGVEGFPTPVPVPVALPGAPVPVPSTPKCEYTCCIHAESIAGHAALLNVGALCNFARSTVAVN